MNIAGNVGQAQIGIGNALWGQVGSMQALTNGINNALFNPYTQNSVSQLPGLISAFSPNGGYNANNLNNSLASAPILINK